MRMKEISMPRGGPIPGADRLMTAMTGMTVIALVLLVGFGRETIMRHKTAAVAEACDASPAVTYDVDVSKRVCRIDNPTCLTFFTEANGWEDCFASGAAVREAVSEPFGLDAIARALRADPG
jgi:hypothetical protein